MMNGCKVGAVFAGIAVLSVFRPGGAAPIERVKAHRSATVSAIAASAVAGSAVAGSTEKSKQAPAGSGVARSAGRRVASTARAQQKSVRVESPCLRDPVPFVRGFGGEVEHFTLMGCDGRPAPHAVERLSLLAQPLTAGRPRATPGERAAGGHAPAGGIKLVAEGLVVRLQSVVDHFHTSKVIIVSGYRPNSLRSLHQSARALDVHLDGVPNERLVEFCRTLPDTGCGYYPNSSFVHIDVRPPSSGHVYWIDASGPGEPPQYVAHWPPRDPSSGVAASRTSTVDSLDEQTDRDSTVLRLPFDGDSHEAPSRRISAELEKDDDTFAP